MQDFPLSAKKVYNQIKKQGISTSFEAVYKALQELLKQKVLARKDNEYSISLEWLNQLSQLSENIQKVYRKKHYSEEFFKTIISAKKSSDYCSNCGSAMPESFCLLCLEPVCRKCGEQSTYLPKLGDKKIWIHYPEECKAMRNLPENKVSLAVLEVSHNCWFSNLSEKMDSIALTTFTDAKDIDNNTHSGILELDTGNKKILERILRHEQIVQIKPLEIRKDRMVIRTRALMKNSAEDIINKNDSVILNPVIATDTKERNIVISPNKAELNRLVKALNNDASCKLVKFYEISLNRFNDLDKLILENNWLRVNKKDLFEALRKFQTINKINSLFDLKNAI